MASGERSPGAATGGDAVQQISAVTLVTADMPAAVHFYETLGFRRLYGGPDAQFTSFAAGSGFVNLQVGDGRAFAPGAWGRVIVWVDDVDTMYERTVAGGFRTETTPADASWGERYFHVRDPDGHELSFARPLADG